MSALVDHVLHTRAHVAPILERERSRTTHQLFILAESGSPPGDAHRRTSLRVTRSTAWMIHIATVLEEMWSGADAEFGDAVERWFATNTERRETTELRRIRDAHPGPSSGPDLRRRIDHLATAAWLLAAVADLAAPAGGSPADFHTDLVRRFDERCLTVGERVAELRSPDPADEELAERAELIAAVEAVGDVLDDALLPGSEDRA